MSLPLNKDPVRNGLNFSNRPNHRARLALRIQQNAENISQVEDRNSARNVKILDRIKS